jgi:BirA family biotin operon repressor/biotin-[acetyl-CoA-carboxylase] ligase
LFSKKHIKLDSVDSTNNYALSMKGTLSFREGLVVTANYQTSGNGQRGKFWESSVGENVLISVVIEPNIPAKDQFLLSQCVALALYDLLTSYTDDVNIKWPNDILVSKQKIAGILIQNILKENKITHSVIGVGLNVNQTKFKSYSPQATSLNLLLNKTFDVSKVQDGLLKYLAERIKQLRSGADQQKEYLSALFLNNKVAAFESEGQKFMGIIQGVSKSGKLQIKLEDTIVTEFDNQEVKFLF